MNMEEVSWQSLSVEYIGQTQMIYVGGHRRMQQLFEAVVSQFQSQHQYDKFIKESQKEYDIKIYRLHNFSLHYACNIHAQLQEKYGNEILKEFPQGWHQNERRLFIWFIVCFIHMKLLDAIKFIDAEKYEKYWRAISRTFWNKDISFLKYQLLNIIKSKGRASWKKDEDHLLTEAYQKFKKGQWNEVAKYFYIQSRGAYFKTPKQCRERWQNHLDSDIKRGEWSPQEDKILFSYVRSKGQRWANIIPLLKNKRTEHMIKNRYKSILNKVKQEHGTSQKDSIDIYLKNLSQKTQFKSTSGDTQLKNEGYALGIVQCQSQDVIDQDEPVGELYVKEKKKRGRKPKHCSQQDVNTSIRFNNHSIKVNPQQKSIDAGQCVIEGLSNERKNFIFNHSINFNQSRGFFDSIHSNQSGGLFGSGRYSIGRGFMPVEDKSIGNDAIFYPERESLRTKNVEAELDEYLLQSSMRARKPSLFFPNDSFMSSAFLR